MSRPTAMDARHRMIGLPARNPRWLVPPRAGAAAFAFELNSPTRPLPRLAALAVRRALRSRTGTRLITRLGGEPTPATRSRLDWTREAFAGLVGSADFALVGWTGRGRSFPKLVTAAVGPNGDPLAFGKLAYTSDTVEGLRYEREVIRFLAATPLAGRVPEELGSFEREGELLLVLSAVEGHRLTAGTGIDDRHVAAIGDLLDLPRPDWLRRPELAARLADIEVSGAPRLAPGLGSLTDGLDATVSADVLAFSHGDLAPWNCLARAEGLGLVDWENAGARPLGWDLFHYAAQVETLVHRSRPTTAGRRLVGDRWLAPVRELVEARCPGAGDEPVRRLQRWYLLDTLLEALEYPSPSSDRTAEVRRAALAELDRQ